MRKIQGPALCGFADYFEKPGEARMGDYGEDKIVIIRGDQAPLPVAAVVLGVLKATKGKKLAFQGHRLATGQTTVKLATKGSTKHKTAVQNARTVAKHAKTVAARVKNFKPPAKHGVHGYVLIGLSHLPHGAVKVKLPSVAQIRSMASELAKAADKLNKGADKHVKDMKSFAEKAKKNAKSSKSGASIHGFPSADQHMLGVDDGSGDGSGGGSGDYNPPTSTPTTASDWQGQLAADADAVAQLPGPDKNYGVPGARPQDYASAVAFEKALDMSNLSLEELCRKDPYPHGVDSSSADPHFYFSNSNDPNFGSVPNPDSVALPTADDPIGDLIVYWTGRFAFMNIGSYTIWFGTYPSGPPGVSDGNQNGTGEGSGLELHEDGWYRWRAKYEDDTHRTYDKRLYKQDNETVDQLVKDSANQNFGPLMGRPDMSILWVPGEGRDRGNGPSPTAGLRFDCSTGGFFWFWDQAPDSAKQAQREIYVKKAQLDWDAALAAGKTNYLSAVATLKLDQAAADAFNRQNVADTSKLNAQIQLQQTQQQADEAKAQSQAGIAQTALDTQSQQADLARQSDLDKLDLQQQQLDMQRQQDLDKLDAQEQQFELDQAQQQAQYEQQNGGRSSGGGGYGGGGGGGGGGYDGGGGGSSGDDDSTPETQSADEAAAIEETVQADADVLGAVLGTPRIGGDDAIIGGDGEVIGVDQYGNVTE